MRDDEMSQIEFVFFFFFFFLLLIFLYLFFCFSFISVPSLSTEFPKFKSTALFSSFCCRKEAKDRKENRNELTKEEEEEGSSEKRLWQSSRACIMTMHAPFVLFFPLLCQLLRRDRVPVT
jgi:cellulose synthase/poly-beta-1,6-N-acetylglucosamine synthase-like glycosyltransferase